MKPEEVNVLADYEAELPVESSWGDESLEIEWLRAFQVHLNGQPNSDSAWNKVKLGNRVRSMLDSIHYLTRLDSPGRTPGCGFGLEDKRKHYSTLKERFSKAGKLLLEIEELTSYRHDKVTDDHTSPIDWPADRKNFTQWLVAGKEMTTNLEEHFKSISHRSRKKMDDETFLRTVLVLRHRCSCTFPQIAALIGSGMAASGDVERAYTISELEIKDDLRRLKKALPEFYKEMEDNIKGQQSV
jgi:hypothetical protein